MSLYKDKLMEHFRNPIHKKEKLDADIKIEGVNSSCGDSITLYITKIDNIIQDLSFTGSGCAISMASADIMCSVLIGMNSNNDVINNFLDLLSSGDANFKENLEVLNVFKELSSYPARQKCARLPWDTIKKALD